MSAAPTSTVAELGVVRLGTRRSALATAQAALVATAIREFGCTVDLVGVTTEGDRSSAPLTETGGTGVFVAELCARLLAGDVDVVVHSLKDLPTTPQAGLTVGAVPRREDPRDALVAGGGRLLADLPAGARVGTGSPRRAAQLRALRPDLDVRPLRGNVDTRIGKVASGALDAVVVAAAGLARLGRLGEATEVFDVAAMTPAPGQGALAIECRGADALPGGRLRALLDRLDDAESRAAVTAERAVLAALEAGCSAPLGAHAQLSDGALRLTAVIVSADGATAIRRTTSGPAEAADELGRRLAAELFGAGAAEVMGELG